jgi:hypothetical protein
VQIWDNLASLAKEVFPDEATHLDEFLAIFSNQSVGFGQVHLGDLSGDQDLQSRGQLQKILRVIRV